MFLLEPEKLNRSKPNGKKEDDNVRRVEFIMKWRKQIVLGLFGAGLLPVCGGKKKKVKNISVREEDPVHGQCFSMTRLNWEGGCYF